MSDISFLESERLLYYAVSETHCNESYLSWLHNTKVNKFLETGRYPSTIESLITFVNQIAKTDALFLAIHLKENGKHIGNIKIDAINRIHQIGEYGILMGDENEWGKGYARESSITIINHCFKKLNLRKITLGVISDNQSAVNLYKKLGFKKEGLYQKHVFCEGGFVDILRMAVFKNDWKW